MTTDSIQVAIRVRPLIRREKESSQQCNWRVNGNSITQINNGKLHVQPSSCFTFDHVFDQIDTTVDVYEKFAKPMIESAMLGFNATIFAYGQTSSGKTFTMLGDKRCPGIIQFAITQMFDHINEDPEREYLLVVTYMEIYNEVITDLLNPSNKNLKIHENSKREVFVSGVTQCPVNGSDQLYHLMGEGEKNRHFGETNMNDKSSRSHTIFAIHIESRERMGPEVGQETDDADGAVLVSQLNLVDLAGSERVSLTGAEGLRLKEGAHINKSLFTLGSVIAKLSEGESFVPFRDSKLTRILQSSLGGNAKTGILCTMTPASVEESISTLKFASRAKTIKNCPSVNEVLDDGAMLKRMKKEIRDLRNQISKLQENTCLSELQSEKVKFQKQLEETKTEHEQQIQRLKESLLYSSRLTEKEGNTKRSKFSKRRETWCPGAMLSGNPLESAAVLAQSVLNFDSSEVSVTSSSEESDTNQPDFISSHNFERILVKEEKKRRSGDKNRRVKFCDTSPSLFPRHPSVSEFVEKEIQTEDNNADNQYRNEIEKLHIQLIQMKKENEDNLEFIDQSNNNLERLMGEKSDLEMKLRSVFDELRIANDEKERLQNDDRIAKYKNEIEDLNIKILQLNKENNDNLEFIDQSNNNLETLLNEKSELERKLHYAAEEIKAANAEKTALQAKVASLDHNVEENKLEAENKELRERLSELQNECSLVNSCAEDLQGEVNELKKENLTLKSRLQEKEKAEEERLSLEANIRDYEQQLAVALKENSQLKINLEEEVKLKEEFHNENKSLKIGESSLKEELGNERSILIKEREDMEQLILDLKDSMIEVESERACLKEEFQCLLLEKDSEIDSLMNELEQVNQNLRSFEQVSREEIKLLTKTFEERVSNRDATISDLVEEVAKFKEHLAEAETEARRMTDLQLEKEALSTKYEELERTKDKDIAVLRQNVEMREEELGAVKEELKKVAEEMERKKDGENDKDQLKEEFEKLNQENRTLQESLEKVTTERDEIKNELSDTITDSVAIQKDIFEAHQKAANYKQRMEQMNEEYENMCTKVTTLEEELFKAKEELMSANGEITQQDSNTGEQSETSDEHRRILEDNEELKKLNMELKLVNEELEKKMESFDDVPLLKTQLEIKQQELKTFNQELDFMKQSNKELQNTIDELKDKAVEMEESRQALEKSLADKQECYDKLSKELNEYNMCGGQTQSKTFNIELEELKKKHEESIRELHNEQKEHEALRTKYEQLKEQIEDNKLSLLRDSNRELTQQKEIDKMRSERRETICVQAQLRVELEKERDEKEKKILELEARCRHLTAENDLAEHKTEVSHKQLEDIKQQMKDIEVLYSQHSKSVVPTNGNDKSAHRLKQVEFNLDITKQKFEKTEVRLRELEHENRQLKGSDIRNSALMEERDVIKAQLVTKTETLRENNRKVNELSIEITQLKSHIDKLTSETKKQKADLEKKVEKIEDLEIQLVQLQDCTNSSQNFDEEIKSLRQEIEGLQSRLKSKSMKCEELLYENKELQKNNPKKCPSKCNGCSDLESCKIQLQDMGKKLENAQSEFDALKVQHEALSFNYDEQLMKENEKEAEAEDAARLKDEVARLKAEILCFKNQSNKDGVQMDNEDICLADESRSLFENQAETIDSLNTTIKTKDEELEHMTFLMDERDMEINEVRSSLKEYEDNLKQLKETIREKTVQSDGLQCEVEMFKIELDEAKQGRNEAMKRIEELRNIIKEQETEMIRLGEKINAMKVSQDVGQTDKNNGDLLDTVECLKKELEEAKSSRNETEQKNFELENRLEAGNREGGSEEVRLENAELKSRLESAKQQIEEQNCKLEEAAESIEELTQVVCTSEDARKNNEEVQSQNEDLKTQLQAAMQQIEEQNCKLEEASESIEELTKVVCTSEDARKNNEEVQSQNEDLKTQLQAAMQQIEEQNCKLEEASESIEELTKDVSSVDIVSKKYEEVQNQNEFLQSQLEAAQQQINEQYCKLEQASASIERLRMVVSEQEELIFNVNEEDNKGSSLIKQELELVKQEVEEEQQLNAQLKMFLKEKENEVEELLMKRNDGSLIELQNNYERVTAELEESKEALMLSQNELEVLRDSYDSLKEKYEEGKKMVTDFETRNAELQNITRENDETLEKIQNELEDALRKVSLSEEKVEEYKAKLQGMSQKFDGASATSHEQSEILILAKQAELEDLQEQLMRVEQEYAKQKNSMQQQLTEMQNSLVEKLNECADLREKLDSGVTVSQEMVNKLKSEKIEMSSALSNERVLNEDLREELASSKRHIAAVEDALQKTRKQKTELEFQIHQDGKMNEGMLSKALADAEAENAELRNTLKHLQDQLEEQQNNLKMTNRADALLKINKLEGKEKEQSKEQKITQLQSIVDQQKVELQQHVWKIQKLENVIKTDYSEVVPYEEYDKETKRLKKIIDEVQDELDEALMKIRELGHSDKDSKEQKITQLQSIVDQQKVELQQHVLKIQKLENVIKTDYSEVVPYEEYDKETKRLKKIIDEVQDELDEALMKIRDFGHSDKDSKEHNITQLQSIVDQQKVELQQHVLKIQELENVIKTDNSEVVPYEEYDKETKRLKKIIDEVQDELDEALMKIREFGQSDKNVSSTKLKEALNEIERLKTIIKSYTMKDNQLKEHQAIVENLESLRIELAGKNMKIQELQYKGFKIAEENEMLRKEVDYGCAKIAKMKQEVRKLREASTQENTIQLKPAPSTGASDVGVVSSVAVFSLKAKVGQLECENEKLKKEKEQLEKDKVTLSLLKTDAGNQVSRLTSEVYCLRKKVKELSRGNRMVKERDEQNVSQHVLAPSNTTDESTISHAQSRPEPTSDRGTKISSKKTENKPVKSNWLSPSKANEMFQDNPNQCQHQ